MPDTLDRGPEMDAAVAAVVGWTARFTGHGVDRRIGGDDSPVWVPFSPSVEVADAIAALEATGLSYEIEVQKGEGSADAYFVRLGEGRYSAMRQHDRHGYTLPEAVCLTILAWAKAKPHLPASSSMRLRAGKDGHA